MLGNKVEINGGSQIGQNYEWRTENTQGFQQEDLKTNLFNGEVKGARSELSTRYKPISPLIIWDHLGVKFAHVWSLYIYTRGWYQGQKGFCLRVCSWFQSIFEVA